MLAKALVVLADGFEDVEAVTVIDVLRRGGIKVTVATLNDELQTRSAHGLMVKADARFAEAENDDYDAVILPGGGEGTANLRGSPAVLERLRRQREDGGLICAICAAPLVLMDAEVLDPEQQVTYYPSCFEEADRPSADVPVVSDGQVITGQAPGASLLFALVILRTLTDDRMALKIAHGMVTDVLS
mgnify:CR=1 FL=1